LRVHLPHEVSRNTSPSHRAPRFRAGKSSISLSLISRDTFIHLPYSIQPTDDFPGEIFLYSNYDVSFFFFAGLFEWLTYSGPFY
jgi:hypothetical protein